MTDIKFSCPKCGQALEAHEQWGGEQTQCPNCKTEFTIPKPEPPRHKTAPTLPTVPTPIPSAPPPAPPTPRAAYEAPPPPPPPVETKLKFVAHTPPERTAAPAPQTRFATAQNQVRAEAKTAKTGGVVKVLVGVVLVAALSVGGFYGYGWFKNRQAAKQAAAAPPPPVVTNAPAIDPYAQPPMGSALPVWTMDVASAQPPDGRVVGSIAGTSFVLAAAPLFFTESGPVLSLRSDTNAVPDRQILIYLRTQPGESLESRHWRIPANMRGALVPTVIRSAKPGPQAPPALRSYASGYVMNLELGAMRDGIIPGRVFVSLPDPEQTVVAGRFNMTTNVVPAR